MLRLGAVGPYHATEMVAAFSRRYPAIQVSVRIGNSEEALQGLVDYRTDVAVLARQPRSAPRGRGEGPRCAGGRPGRPAQR